MIKYISVLKEINNEIKYYFYINEIDRGVNLEDAAVYEFLVDDNGVIRTDSYDSSNIGKKFKDVYDSSIWHRLVFFMPTYLYNNINTYLKSPDIRLYPDLESKIFDDGVIYNTSKFVEGEDFLFELELSVKYGLISLDLYLVGTDIKYNLTEVYSEVCPIIDNLSNKFNYSVQILPE